MSELNSYNQNSIKKNFLKKLFTRIFLGNSEDSEQKNHDLNQLKTILNEDDYEDADDNDTDVVFINGKKKKKKKNNDKDQKIKKIIDDLINGNPEDYKANQQRNLDRETGGTELPETYVTNPKDVWDNRYEEIQEMGDIDNDDYNGDDKASMIWENKRKKKKKEEELAKANFSAPVAVSVASTLSSKNKNNSRNF